MIALEPPMAASGFLKCQLPQLNVQQFGVVQHSALDFRLTRHMLHCPKCDLHLTSLLACPGCGRRYQLDRAATDQETQP